MSTDDEDLQEIRDEDLSSLESAAMLLETFSFDSEDTRLILATNERLDMLIKFTETSKLPEVYICGVEQETLEERVKIFEECKGAIGKCIVGIASGCITLYFQLIDLLIIKILGEDKTMQMLFSAGRAPFVKRMLKWIQSREQRLIISGG